MYLVSKHLFYSEMRRREKSFLKTHRSTVKISFVTISLSAVNTSGGIGSLLLCVPTLVQWVSLGQTEGTEGGVNCPVLPGSSVAKLGVFTNFPLCWHLKWERVAHQAQRGVWRGAQFVGLMPPGLASLAPSCWGPLGTGPWSALLMPPCQWQGQGEKIQPFKISLKD